MIAAAILPRVSIIVPAYNEAERIDDCVQSLLNQSYPSDLLQIIIVDNGSRDGTFERLRQIPGILALQEPRPGSYAARNYALKHATGDVVCFTDADCIADVNWVRNAIRHLGDINVGVVAGHVELDFMRAGRLSSSELFEKCFSFKQAENARNNVCVTANWCSSRSLLDRMGGFDGTARSGGDHRLAARIAAAGYRIVYAPDAIVRHPARACFDDLTRKRRRVIGGAWLSQCRIAGKPFARFVASLFKETLQRLRAIFTRLPLPHADRLRLSALLLFLCGVSVAEAVRLQLGGEPRRQ